MGHLTGRLSTVVTLGRIGNGSVISGRTALPSLSNLTSCSLLGEVSTIIESVVASRSEAYLVGSCSASFDRDMFETSSFLSLMPNADILVSPPAPVFV